MFSFRKISYPLFLVLSHTLFLYNMCTEINPELKQLLDKLKLDEKYHELANQMFNEADKTITQDKNPLKHIEGLNLQVRMLLACVSGPENLMGTQIESMGKKILQYAKQEFAEHIIAESTLKTKYNMTDENIVRFKMLYDDTKHCVEKLDGLFHCV